ncbi:MAG: type I-C CRISPR-associated protein Cas7/Csd2 [Bacillota bacterium]|nr:type I-C CRISPR-associated protein Cas7/Csd2 [Bacillota bacterium]
MSEVIKNRYEFVVLFDVENGNPNGDPDAGNMPRIDPESGLGLVTDVCLKRKIRNYVETLKEDQEGYKIYIKEDVPLNRSDREACINLGINDTDEKKVTESLKKLKKSDTEADVKIRDYMCQNFYDIRTFGAVMTTFVKAALNCGQVRGPVQIGFARSIDPIVSQEVTITRVAITTEKDAENKSTEMGRKSIVPYGLYRVEGYVSANLARKVTGFSEDDLNLLWEAIINMFEHDHSAARGNMAVRELIVFKHSKELGDCPAYKLFDSIEIRKKDEVEYPRSYQDYVVEIHEEDIPSSVEMRRMI